MNETKPVPTKIAAFFQGGLIGLTAYIIYMNLFMFLFLGKYATGVSTFAIGGCVGLSMWLKYKKYLTTANLADPQNRQAPTKIGAFFKGGFFAYSVYLVSFLPVVWFLSNVAYTIDDGNVTTAIDARLIRMVCYIHMFLSNGFAGLLMRWSYRKYFINPFSKKTETHA